MNDIEGEVEAGLFTLLHAAGAAQSHVEAKLDEVDRLEADGLVSRAADPHDRRSCLAVMTAAGREACDVGTAIQREAEDDSRYEQAPGATRRHLPRMLTVTHFALRGDVTRAAVAAALGIVITAGAAYAQPVGVEMSPAVTWDPYNEVLQTSPEGRLTAADLKLARERAARLFAVVKLAPSFNRPTDHATLMTSTVRKASGAVVNQSFTPYWSSPGSVRRGKDGVLMPRLGGVHRLLYIETNRAPATLVDGATRGEFSRPGDDGQADGYFAAPRTFGEIGGGTIYADRLVFTRDGRSALVPAPIGTLLQIEVARLTKLANDVEAGFARQLKDLDASMTPQAVAEQRARRERIWSKETRDPAALVRRLDAAHRTDEYDYQRQAEYFSLSAPRIPSSILWRPRLALEAAQARLAALDAAGRQQPACGRMEPGFDSQSGVRFEVAGTMPDCVPMVQMRPDLVDPKGPVTEVQLLTVWFNTVCGEHFGGKPRVLRDDYCESFVPLLRELDWAAARKVLGW
jgi:hypothetical protein